MKVNVFKIENDKVGDLLVELEDNKYVCEADNEDENSYTALYLQKNNHKKRDGWNIIGNYYQKKNLKITLKV